MGWIKGHKGLIALLAIFIIALVVLCTIRFETKKDLLRQEAIVRHRYGQHGYIKYTFRLESIEYKPDKDTLGSLLCIISVARSEGIYYRKELITLNQNEIYEIDGWKLRARVLPLFLGAELTASSTLFYIE